MQDNQQGTLQQEHDFNEVENLSANDSLALYRKLRVESESLKLDAHFQAALSQRDGAPNEAQKKVAALSVMMHKLRSRLHHRFGISADDEATKVEGILPQDSANRELAAALHKLIPHVLHYAGMPHAHADAHKDLADARAVLAKLNEYTAGQGKLPQNQVANGGMQSEEEPEEYSRELEHCATVVSDWLAGGCDTNAIPRPHIAALVALTNESAKQLGIRPNDGTLEESQALASAAGAALQILESIRVTHPELIADNAPVGWGMNKLRQELGKVQSELAAEHGLQNPAAQ